MCNRKTKQWHTKPKLAEYQTSVYCIVNELKTVPSETGGGGHRGGAELTADLRLWSCEGM